MAARSGREEDKKRELAGKWQRLPNKQATITTLPNKLSNSSLKRSLSPPAVRSWLAA